MRTTCIALLAIALLQMSMSHAAEGMKVSTSKTPVPKKVATEIGDVLGEACYSVASNGTVLANFWIRREVATEAAGETIPYPSIQEGTLLGVVEIKSEDLADFRKQPLLPGVFTLRLGWMPQDGNHMGAALYPEFLCLSPADADTKLAPIPHNELMKLSKQSLDTGHPAVLFLQPFATKPTFDFPLVNTNDLGHTVLNVMSQAKGKDGRTVPFPIGIVIVGSTTAE